MMDRSRASRILKISILSVIILLRGTLGFLNVNLKHSHSAARCEGSHRRMFTGFVEEMGTVLALEEREDMLMWDGSVCKEAALMTIQGDVVMQGAYPGCNICVNGVCLTATELHPEENIFTVELAQETLLKTYLGCLQPGDKVNLERPASEAQTSGHLVQGKVDSWGEITEKWQDQETIYFRVQVPTSVIKYLVPNGFVAVDGTSLTVGEVDANESWFTFSLAASSQKRIILPGKNAGDPVNVEVNALDALIPRFEQLEADYQQLQAKTKFLQEMNEDLEQKVQSLENGRLLDNGAHQNANPNAKMVTGPEARQINGEWLEQQQLKMQHDNKPKTKVEVKRQGGPKGKRVVSGAEARKLNADWLREQKTASNERFRRGPPNTPKPNPKRPQPQTRVVSGQEAQNVNEDWLRQRKGRGGSLENGKLSPTNASGNLGPEPRMVSGEEARKLNLEWLEKQNDQRQQRKIRFRGPVAQQVNDEWKRRQERENEKRGFHSVKRVRDDGDVGFGADGSAVGGGSQKLNNVKRMVGGSHAKRINDEWLQQTGKEEYQEELGIQDATVLDQQTDYPQRNRIMPSDQELSSREPLRVHDDGVPLNQRPGSNLDIQDAMLIDSDDDGNDSFIQHQFDEKPEATSDDSKQANDYFFANAQTGDPHPETPQVQQSQPGQTSKDPYEGASNQQSIHQQSFAQHEQNEGEYSPEAMRGEFNDPWFDKSGRSPDQNRDDMMDSDGYVRDTRVLNNQGPHLKGLQPDPGLHVTGIQPDQGDGGVWGGRF